MPQYLSTDPNAGDTNEASQYLSTDPSAGDNEASEPKRTWTDTAVDALPLIGGIAGGLAGLATGPGAIGTAAIGGAGGEAWKRVINDLRGKGKPADETPGNVLTGIATAGAAQGAGQAAGMGLAKVAGALAPRVATWALKPSMTLVNRRAGIERLPSARVVKNITNTVLENRLKNPDQAAKLVSSLGGQVDDVVRAAEQANPKLALDTSKRIPRYIEKLMKSDRGVENTIDPGPARASINNYVTRIKDDSPLSQWDRGTRVFRNDIKPSRGLQIERAKSYFDPAAGAGDRAAGRTVERAVRDAVKEAVPETAPILRAQGNAIDARNVLESMALRNLTSQPLGGASGLAVVSGNPGTGALLQFLRRTELGSAHKLYGASKSKLLSTILPQLLAGAIQDDTAK